MSRLGPESTQLPAPDPAPAAPLLDRRRLVVAASLISAGIVSHRGADAAPPEEKPMSKTPDRVVDAFMAAMAVKDYDTGLQYVAADCEYTNIPLATVRGPAGVRAVLEPFFAPTLENQFIILRRASVGPIVFLERLDRHLLATGWVELPVTGVYEVHDGKITVYRDYFDALTITSKWPAPQAQ
jgi:limonene-1,2-epoxide hydrolase